MTDTITVDRAALERVAQLIAGREWALKDGFKLDNLDGERIREAHVLLQEMTRTRK